MTTSSISNKVTYDNIDPIFEKIEDFTRFLERILKSARNLFSDMRNCYDAREMRKEFEALLKSVLPQFKNLSKDSKAEIELSFFKIVNELEARYKELCAELDKVHSKMVSVFMKREVRKTIYLFKELQTSLAKSLYGTPRSVIRNTKEADKLIEAWGTDYVED